uniref:Chemokine interleukin-8-like domain-containing protein n=1 Tax=Amphilophus citrinellus TaxID=61819 RepID=A0A3Q0RPW8_AMPCI
MKTSLAIQCIVLLACMLINITYHFQLFPVIPKCRCLTTSKPVNPSLITGVQEFGPRPYCNKRQVIVTLKDGTERCLDPEAKFTKAVLRRINVNQNGEHTLSSTELCH